jgi:aspartate kinase
MTYREVAEMAHLGAKVIHPRAVEIAMVDRVPLLIKGTFSDAPGTLICDTARQGVEIRGDRVVTGIAHIAHLGQVRVGNLNGGLGHRHLDVFRAMADAGISVDLINVSPELISFAVGEEHLERARQTVESLGLAVEATGGFAKVSAVGAGMRGVPGVMARVIAALSGRDVSIHQTTDSHTSISCLIRAEDLERAVKALHEEFELDQLEHSGGGAVS